MLWANILIVAEDFQLAYVTELMDSSQTHVSMIWGPYMELLYCRVLWLGESDNVMALYQLYICI